MVLEPMRIYASPARYVQGAGAFAHLGKEINTLGLQGKAFILATQVSGESARAVWEKSLREAGIEFTYYPFEGECSDKHIRLVQKEIQSAGASYVIAMGGGKTLDIARAAAEVLRLETVVCPTIAATDAPCIALSVVYTDAGEMQELRSHRKNPLLVLVDSQVIARAPKRFLVAGMGDALATYYEARASRATYALNPRGGLMTEAGFLLATLCRDILLADGPDVIAAYDTHAVTPAFERIVEANILLSGLGVELCNVAGAHALHNGLTQWKEVHGCYHGEKVAFGLITQLILEGEDFQEIHRLLAFYKQVGLPCTFQQLGVENPSDEKLLQAATRALIPGESMASEPCPLTPKKIIDAMRYADSLGRAQLFS